MPLRVRDQDLGESSESIFEHQEVQGKVIKPVSTAPGALRLNILRDVSIDSNLKREHPSAVDIRRHYLIVEILIKLLKICAEWLSFGIYHSNSCNTKCLLMLLIFLLLSCAAMYGEEANILVTHWNFRVFVFSGHPVMMAPLITVYRLVLPLSLMCNVFALWFVVSKKLLGIQLYSKASLLMGIMKIVCILYVSHTLYETYIYFKDNFRMIVANYPNTTMSEEADQLQIQRQCCGYDSPADYKADLPPSCCANPECTHYHSVGCDNTSFGEIHEDAYDMAQWLLAIAGVQIFAAYTAAVLAENYKYSKGYVSRKAPKRIRKH